jgi:Zn-dependent protease
MLYRNTGSTYRLFSAFGIPVQASASSAILIAMVLLSFGRGGPEMMVASIFIAAVVFFSIVAHEFGHGLMVRRLGHRPGQIILHWIGGVLTWDASRATRKDRIKVALAGPAVSLLLGLAAFLAYMPLHKTGGFGLSAARSEPVLGLMVLKMTLSAAVLLNVFWGLFNLLPIYPMDGGQALRSALGLKMRQSQAVRRSLQVSMGTAVAVGLVALLLTGDIFITILLGVMFYLNWEEWRRLGR